MTYVLIISFALLCAATSLALWRVVRGPTTLDRILAFDAVLVYLVGMVVVASIHRRTAEYLELILVITSLAFFTTVVFYYYLNRLPANSPDFQGSDEQKEGRT
jgi:multicomponent Na+:H+ antiporter subunit F